MAGHASGAGSQIIQVGDGAAGNQIEDAGVSDASPNPTW